MINGGLPVSGLTQKTAQVMWDNASLYGKNSVKREVREQLRFMKENGEISQEEYKAARKFFDGDLAKAISRRNQVKSMEQKSDAGIATLNSEDAQNLMLAFGLTPENLIEACKLYAGYDFEVSYTKLSKSERKAADNGQLTSSELKNIKNYLNNICLANGNNYILNDNDVKTLMEGLGVHCEPALNAGKIVRSALCGASVGALTGSLTGENTTVTAVSQVDNVIATPTSSVQSIATSIATASVNTVGRSMAVGTVLGAFVGTGIEIAREVSRKEKPYGVQGGDEGGLGSATNKTEAKMKELENIATAGKQSESETPLRPELPYPPEDEQIFEVYPPIE